MPTPSKSRKRVTPSLASSPRRGNKTKPPPPPDSSSDSDDDILEVTVRSPQKSISQENSKNKMIAKPSSPAKRRLAPALEHARGPTKNSEESEGEDHSEDEDLEENDLTPTLAELSCLCWKCQVELKMPQSPTKRSPQKLCMYDLHVHPTLSVPTCSVCVQQLDVSEDDDEVCHGCAQDDGTLVLCDNCPRTFCTTCVAQAYGGGIEGRRMVRRLQNEDGEWKCPKCNPQPALKQLQEELEYHAPPTTTEDDEAAKDRSFEVAAQELIDVEAEKSDQLRLWDDPEALQAQRDEIKKEIQSAKPNLSEKKLEALVEEEMEEWKDRSIKHEQRLGDKISSLQDELENVYGVDLAYFYKECIPSDEQKAGDGADEEPEWKRAADEEISKRLSSEPRAALQKVFGQDVYEREYYEEVEDLMTRPEDERECPGSGFRSTQERPSMRQILEATEEEDRMLALRKVKILSRFDDETDKQDMVAEEKETSQRGVGGASRIRRDAVVQINQQLNVRRKKAPPKPNSASLPAAEAAPPVIDKTSLEAKTGQVAPKPEVETPPTAAAATTDAAAAANDCAVDLTDDTPIVFVKAKAKVARAGIKKALTFDKANTGYNLDDGFFGEEEGTVPNKEEIEEEEYYCSSDPRYKQSDLVLSSPEAFHSTSEKRVKTISVSTELTKHLKSHQQEGVKFIWNNACVDFNVRTSRAEELHEEKNVGGCILAHSMGLGKSLTAIAVMHTMMNHPSMRSKEGGKRLVHSILLVVPVNTIASWKTEFSKWVAKLEPAVLVYDLSEHQSASRPFVVRQWLYRGGVMIVSKDSFQKIIPKLPQLQDADAIFIDEAHQCLANRGNAIYKALEGVKTKRRVLLTGTPFQNNASEYYRMVHFMRKGVLDDSEAAFERDFARPIAAGMPSDASKAAIQESTLKGLQLKRILAPYVNRKDSTVLRKSLPPMQQVILHLRPSRTQSQLYKKLKSHEHRNGITNFLNRYHLARPLHNHPACLLMQSHPEDPDESVPEKDENNRPWFANYFEKHGEKATAVDQGSKVVMFLHILCSAIEVGDKVVLFSQSLKTLDFLESVLQKKKWKDHVKSLKKLCPNQDLGGWERNREYLRIDGGTDGKERGQSVAKFQRDELEPSERVQLFLISSKAGGVGITLTAANRVILFDSHFNPCVTEQALYRCYRFGQTKPVFAYRFLTEGTGEEKVYSRSVTKTGLSLRVIDGKDFKGSFTEQELTDMVVNDTWVQCDRCERWRMLKGEDEEDLPDKWYCEMNQHDTINNNCDASEKDAAWYHANFQLEKVDVGQLGAGTVGAQHQYKISAGRQESNDDNASDAANDRKKEALKRNDVILTRLLDDSFAEKAKGTHPSSVISKWYYHDSLLAAEDLDTEFSEETPDGDLKPAAKEDPPAAASVAKSRTQKSRVEGREMKESKKQRSQAVPSPLYTPPSGKKVAEQTEASFTITRMKKSSGSSARKPEPTSESKQPDKKTKTTVVQRKGKTMIKESPSARQTNSRSMPWDSPKKETTDSPKRKSEDDCNTGNTKRVRRLEKRSRPQKPPPPREEIIDLMDDSDSGDEN